MRPHVSLGQHTQAGDHAQNQDFHGAILPEGHTRLSKGIALALADGISSSALSHLASQTAVRGFLEDYYATSEAWSVRRAAQGIIGATNSWLHAQTQRGEGRFDADRGYVCTFTALILKGRDFHLFHVGDARVYRLHPHALEQLTEDHRLRLSAAEEYLARALGANASVEIDYHTWEAVPQEVYLLATDGAYTHFTAADVHAALASHGDDLDAVARQLVEMARARGSTDDATVLLLRVEALPEDGLPQPLRRREGLALPPPLQPGMLFEGFRVLRALQVTARSHIHLAVDDASGQHLVLKTPATDLRENPAYLDGFVLEEWVARRVHSPHVIRPWLGERARHSLFVAMEYIEGQTLAQWMADHPRPALESVRTLVEQLGAGLQALHHREMLHQDLRPENVMIDADGTVKLIDLASVHVAGLAEGLPTGDSAIAPGSLQYMAPEYLLGEGGSPRADLFALAAITYQMLCGRLPYGLDAARLRTAKDLRRLRYTPVRLFRPELPAWLDQVLEKALQPDATRRQEAVSEFLHDLRHPDTRFATTPRQPFIERDPLLFWKCATALSSVLAIGLLVIRAIGH